MKLREKLNNRKIAFGIIAILLFLICLSTIVGSGVANSRSSQLRMSNAAFSFPANEDGEYLKDANGKPIVPSVGPNYIFIMGNISNIDTSSNTLKIHCNFVPAGDFVDSASYSNIFNITTDFGMLQKPLKHDVTFAVDDKTIHFAKGAIMTSIDLPISLANGDPNTYPFDKYTTDVFYFSGSFSNSTDGTTGNQVPVLFAIVGALQSWKIDTPFVKDISVGSKGLSIAAEINISRSYTTRIFSMFMFLMLWSISILVLTMAITIWTRGRTVEPPTLVVTTSMLFAMPALRNAQPGVPVIGCTFDVIGFFWNMFLGTVAVSLVLLNYIVMHKRECTSHVLLPLSERRPSKQHDKEGSPVKPSTSPLRKFRMQHTSILKPKVKIYRPFTQKSKSHLAEHPTPVPISAYTPMMKSESNEPMIQRTSVDRTVYVRYSDIDSPIVQQRRQDALSTGSETKFQDVDLNA